MPHAYRLAAILCALSLASHVNAASMVDQANDVAGPSGGFVIPSTAVVGQTFVPTLSTVDFVELQLNIQTLVTGIVEVKVRDTGPGGALLATSAQEAITNPGLPVQLYRFDMPTPAPVTPGDTYFLEVMHVSGGNVGVFLGGGAGANGYADGEAYVRGVPSFDDDLWFREGGTRDRIVPEPATAAMGMLAFGALALRRRRAA